MKNNVTLSNNAENGQCLETRFLLACLRDSGNIEQHSSPQDFAKSNINWNYILKLAYAHGLISVLYLKLNSKPNSGLPAEFTRHLENHFRANELRNRMLREEFRNLMEAFHKANIKAIPLKGIVYSQTLYSNPSARQFADIDFLLHDEDIEPAKQLLEDQGYLTVYEHRSVSDGSSKLATLQESIYRSIYHEYELQSRDRLINIDLHWRLSPRMYPTDLNIDLVWRNLVPAVINGIQANILSDEMDILYLCMHAAKDGWCELKWAVDISELLRSKRNIDWHQVWHFSEYLRCKKMVLVGLALANWVTGAVLPEGVAEEISSSRATMRAVNDLQRRLLSNPDRKFSRVPCLLINRTYLQLCDSTADKVTYIFRVLTYAQPRDFNVLGLTGRLLPIWPWLRPFRIFVHCTKKSLIMLFNKEAR